ncbi:MAG: hypothetical protein ACTHLE_09200 [Agriterribacter sp.]
MCKTTTGNTTSSSRVRQIYPPCAPEPNPGKVVKVRVHDPKNLIGSNNDLKNALTSVQQFYNGLQQTPQLPADLVSDLSKYTFEVTYTSSAPSDNEIRQLRRMDFPVYLFHTPGISANSSSIGEMQTLLERHEISPPIRVRLIDEDPNVITTTSAGDAYKSLEDDWEKEEVLGFGFPGNYYSQGTCHKLGLIKVDAIQKSAAGWSSIPDRFKGVIEHELGHMLGLGHFDGTVMNKKYQPGATQFTIAQIDIIRDTLKILSP